MATTIPRREELASRAARLRDLHRPGAPLVLPNAWDAYSAKLIAGAGYPAIATSSAAVALTLGREDDDSMPADEAFGAVKRVAQSVELPVTADLEAGYGLEPAEFVSRLLEAGAVGCNLEDTDHRQPGLVEVEVQASRLAGVKAAARAAGVDIVLNARVDVRFGGDAAAAALEEAIRRGGLYLQAGADCVYPIFLTDEHEMARFVRDVGGPVNALLRTLDAASIARLKQLGVARISMGSGPFRAAYRALQASLDDMRH